MALAVEQHIPIKYLDDLLRYLTEDSGYTKGVAEYMANQRYKDGHLRLTKVEYVGVKPQGEVPIDPQFGHIEVRRGRMRFVPRELLWRKAIYKIAEGCDARAIWPCRPPASQPAPDQQLVEDKVGPDSFKAAHSPSAGQPRQKPLTSKEWLGGEIKRREDAGNIPEGKITEFSGQIHTEMEKAGRAGIVKWVIEPRTIEHHLRTTTKLFPKKKRSPKS
jgi:hypothetical protein